MSPATFEENKAYVAEVLVNTADKRLMPDGQFARIDALPKRWPSHAYQRIVNAAGAPSEEVVRLCRSPSSPDKRSSLRIGCVL